MSPKECLNKLLREIAHVRAIVAGLERQWEKAQQKADEAMVVYDKERYGE